MQGVFVTQRTLCTICPSEVRRTREYLGPTKASSIEREHVPLSRESLSHKEHFAWDPQLCPSEVRRAGE